MNCPFCLSDSKVIDKRDAESATRRRRECLECGKRFTTYERVDSIDLFVVKKDGSRQPFDRAKLRAGIMRACEKRPVSQEQIENALNDIETKLRQQESTEFPSRLIGELTIKMLKKLDKVAYIRFASVYRDFKDIEDFEKELRGIKEK